MAYGSDDGLTIQVNKYETRTDFSVTEKAEARIAADAHIDLFIVECAPLTALPLASPHAVIGLISNMLTAYYLLKTHYIGNDEPDIAWKELLPEAEALLKKVCENSAILGADVANSNQILSNQTNVDRTLTNDEFSGGAQTEVGSMPDWDGRYGSAQK